MSWEWTINLTLFETENAVIEVVISENNAICIESNIFDMTKLDLLPISFNHLSLFSNNDALEFALTIQNEHNLTHEEIRHLQTATVHGNNMVQINIQTKNIIAFKKLVYF